MKESIILITRGYASERASERRANEEEAERGSRGKEKRKQRKNAVLGRPFQLLPPPEFISDPRKISRKDSRSQFGAGLH